MMVGHDCVSDDGVGVGRGHEAKHTLASKEESCFNNDAASACLCMLRATAWNHTTYIA